MYTEGDQGANRESLEFGFRINLQKQLSFLCLPYMAGLSAAQIFLSIVFFRAHYLILALQYTC